MRPWLAVIVALLLVAVLLVGFQVVERQGERARASQLLQEAGQPGACPATSAAGTIRVFSDGVWRETKADIDYAGGLTRLTMGSGPSRTVLLDDGRRMWRLQAAAKTATAVGPAEGRLDWSRLRRSYDILPAGAQTVAGRPCQGVRLVSRRTHRPALAQWIDPTTQLVTKRLTYDADGHLVAATELTSFRPQAQAAQQALVIPADWRKVDPEETDVRRISMRAFRDLAGYEPRPPARLPTGYTEEGLYLRTCPRGCPYAELRYSDGLRVLSVYEHRPCGRGQGRGPHRYGRGGGGECGGGPPDAHPVLIDRGQAKTVRQRRPDLMVVVTGDLTERGMLEVVLSIP